MTEVKKREKEGTYGDGFPKSEHGRKSARSQLSSAIMRIHKGAEVLMEMEMLLVKEGEMAEISRKLRVTACVELRVEERAC